MKITTTKNNIMSIKEIITDLLATLPEGDVLMKQGNNQRVFAVAKQGTQTAKNLSVQLKTKPENATHVLYVEFRGHRAGMNDDEMSFPGHFLGSREGQWVEAKAIWIVADETGKPNINHLCRDGGALAKLAKSHPIIGTL